MEAAVIITLMSVALLDYQVRLLFFFNFLEDIYVRRYDYTCQ